MVLAIDGLHDLIPTESGKPGAEPDFPRYLSQTGIFRDIRKRHPAPGFFPYELAQPAWANGARTRRWMAIPGTGKVDAPASGQLPAETFWRTKILHTGEKWVFPAGSVFVQHLEWPCADGLTIPLETRILVLDEGGGVRLGSYVWNDTGEEAQLNGSTADRPVKLASRSCGKGTPPEWIVTGRESCIACHGLARGHVLGANPAQMNRTVPSSGGAVNQLEVMAKLGYFSNGCCRNALPVPLSISRPSKDRIRPPRGLRHLSGLTSPQTARPAITRTPCPARSMPGTKFPWRVSG